MSPNRRPWSRLHGRVVPRPLSRAWSRMSVRSRRWVAAATIVALAAGTAGYVDLRQVWEDLTGPSAPAVQDWGDPATGRDGKVKRRPRPVTGPGKPVKVRWPKAAGTVVPLSGSPVNVGGMRVTAKPTGDSGADSGRVRVRTFGHKRSSSAGAAGILVEVSGGSGVRKARLTFSYRKFTNGYGGDYGGRLRIYRADDCAGPRPTSGCATSMVPLPTVNDSEKRTVSAVVVAPSDGQAFAIAASEDSAQGTYTATALSPSSSWSAGGSSGGFSWSYPIGLPRTPGELSPSVGLSYSSQSVDGQTAATNNQGSWIGTGFTYEPGYIERRYKPCSDDGHDNSGDLCWAWNNATIMLDGRSGELVKDGDVWRLSNDDGSVVERLTGADSPSNPDNNDEHWKLTTTDGTEYFFGLHRLPGWTAGDEVTDSVWTTPVFGDDSGEPCHDSTFGSSHCRQAWRWNLDYVRDPRGNVVSYFYNKETNYYARNGRTDVNGVAYTRGGYLTRIDYGQRDGSVYSTTAPARVKFTVAERCIPSAETDCEPSDLNDSTAQYWPDVPWDRNCKANTHCDASQISPSFWTRKRLVTITTKVRSNAAWAKVNSWNLEHTFVSNADTTRSLWLSTITRTGHYGSDLTLPSTSLYAVQMANRIDTIGDSISPMVRPRLVTVVTDTGGTIDVTYSGEDCAPGDTPSPSSNTRRCYPVRWEPPSYSSTITDWFHKYVVDEVIVGDLMGSSPTQRTHYTYNGGAAWRYTKPDGITKKSNLTWGDWRGYKSVTMRKAYATGLETRTDYTYFRGMHGDKNGSGGTRSVSIKDSEQVSHTDYDQLAGIVLESATYNGDTVISKSIATQWRHQTAKATHPWRDQTAFYVKPETTRTYTALEAGGWRVTRTDRTYDDTYGQLQQVNDHGDTSTTADDRCTTTSYVTPGTADNLVAFPSESITTVGACGSVVDPVDGVIAHDRMYYDNQPLGATPTAGEITKTEERSGYDGTQTTFAVVAETEYDSYGRVTKITNALGAATTSTYTDTEGLNTRTVVSNALGHTTTTDYLPVVGQPSTVTDPNGKVTSLSYDALGRLSAVWLPNRSKANGQNPNQKFSYQVSGDQPVAIKTQSLKNDGVSYRTSYEILDGWLRSRQTQAPAPHGDRLVTDTFYNALGAVKSTNAVYHATGAPSGTLLEVADGEVNGQVRYSYDNAGRVIGSTFAVAGQPRWSTAVSYGGDRVPTTPPQGGTPTTVIKDARGNTTELRKYHGDAPSGAYDATRYTYTPAGHLKTVVNPADETWSYTYDARGRRVKTVDPDTGTSTSTYDVLGRLTRTEDARGVRLAYEYDVLDRKTKVSKVVDPNDETTWVTLAEWIWDRIHTGQLAGSYAYDGDLTFLHVYNERDEFYRPLRETYHVSGASAGALAGQYQFNRSYNLDGTLAAVGFPAAGGLGGEGVVNVYDDLGRLTRMYGQKNYADDILYSPIGQLGQVGLYAGATRSWLTLGYEKGTNRLTNSFVSVNGSRLSDTSYTYDPAGNVTSIVDDPTVAGGQRDAQCFRYDHLRRLTEAWTTSNTGDGDTACASAPTSTTIGGPGAYWHEYDYDASGNGNLASRTVRASTAPGTPGEDVTSSYDYYTPEAGGPHWVKTVTDTAGGSQVGQSSYTYDAAGNTLSRPGPNGMQELTWGPFGRLASVAEAGKTSRFSYDADGNRYLRRDPDGTTLYLPGMELRQPTGTTTVTATRYYQLPGGVTYVRTPAGGQYQVGDRNGTATLAIDPDTGQGTYRRFDPYGNPRGAQPDAWSGSRGFVDGVMDPTGLTHLGAREYDPGLGRFISADPVTDTSDAQQLQGYRYGNGNPVTFSDPSGLAYCADPDCDQTATKNPTTGEWDLHGDDGDDDVLSCSPNCGTSGGQVDKAEDNYRDALARKRALKRKMVKMGKLFLNIVLEVTGIQAGLDCFLKGDVGGCVETAVNVITGMLGGLLAKIGLKYAFKWKAAARLAGKVKKLVGGIMDIAKSWSKTEKGVTDARKALKAARAAKRATKTSDSTADTAKAAGKCSFSGDTKVRLANGKSKPISKVTPGDRVRAADPKTGEKGARTVTHVWVHRDTVVDLKIGGKRVTTTEDHPFWNATDHTWQQAQHLDPGDKVRTAGGKLLTIGGLDRRSAHTDLAYNLTVADIHTYHVYAGNRTVLVHNTCPMDDVVDQTLGAGGNAREGVGLVEGNINEPGVRTLIDEAGNASGCHVCGSRNSGTRSGSWIPDHQPPTSTVTPGTPQTAYPHCLPCARRQGGIVRQLNEEHYDFGI